MAPTARARKLRTESASLFSCRKRGRTSTTPWSGARFSPMTPAFGGTYLPRALCSVGSWIASPRARRTCPSEAFLGGTCLSRPLCNLPIIPLPDRILALRFSHRLDRSGQFMNCPDRLVSRSRARRGS